MSITNLEREIRFSNFTLEEYSVLSNDYRKQLLSLLEHDETFLSVLESKTSYIKPKNTLLKEAEELANSVTEPIATFGKAVIKFLARGAKGIDDLCIAISVVIMIGGIVLATCITLIIGIILYAVTIVPSVALISALAMIDKKLGSIIYESNDTNVQKFARLSSNIQNHPEGIKDIKELEKLVSITESLNVIIEQPELSEIEEAHTMVNLLKCIDERVATLESDTFDVMLLRLDNIASLAPSHLTYISQINNVMETSSLREDDLDMFMILENAVSKPLLSCESLLNSIMAIVTDACSEKSVGKFFNAYRDTVNYELMNENYADLPILKATNYVFEYIQERCGSSEYIMESCEVMESSLNEIIHECVSSVKEDGFNPDQLDIGSLTPLPVASRRIGDVICDICDAETYDEITEAMLTLGRMAGIIQENYYVETTTDGLDIIVEGVGGKAARKVSNKVEKKVAKTATKDKTGNIKESVKRTLDPMEKFIQEKYKTLKEKDANQRREIILKGGVLPKVWRWVKRSIKLLIGAGVGKYVPAVAIITGIGFVAYIVSDKILDKRERAKIMRELDEEIMICNEKIEDSRGDDDKQKKYELMRIRNELQRTRDKIHYGLRY